MFLPTLPPQEICKHLKSTKTCNISIHCQTYHVFIAHYLFVTDTREQLNNAFVFASLIVLSLNFLNPKFQLYSHLLWRFRPVSVRPGWKSCQMVTIDVTSLSQSMLQVFLQTITERKICNVEIGVRQGKILVYLKFSLPCNIIKLLTMDALDMM